MPGRHSGSRTDRWPYSCRNDHAKETRDSMNNPLRSLLAGAAAYKWGGGCLGTIIIFLLVYTLLGSC